MRLGYDFNEGALVPDWSGMMMMMMMMIMGLLGDSGGGAVRCSRAIVGWRGVLCPKSRWLI